MVMIDQATCSSSTARAIKPAETVARVTSGMDLVRKMGTEEDKKAIVVKARCTARGRFLAVGVFLSVIAISSKMLIDSMRKVWKIRGHMDSNQLADRRFVLEFSEEGDFNHVTRGGPWRYRDDVVLVDALQEGVDLEKVIFTTIPIWTQFRNIPFYLLSKELARDLGRRMGEFILIDNNARGNICDKFIRARVCIPIDQAIQRWIPLINEFGDEEVAACVHYKRLPNFCLFYGFIGHKEAECSLLVNQRKKRYCKDLRVQLVNPDDPRCWFLPDFIGQVWHRHSPAMPWRMAQPDGRKSRPTCNNAIIVHVATKVGNLSV
jgi:hypothetical protein